MCGVLSWFLCGSSHGKEISDFLYSLAQLSLHWRSGGRHLNHDFSRTQRPVTNNQWEDGWRQSNRAQAYTDYKSCSHRHSTGQGACQNQ